MMGTDVPATTPAREYAAALREADRRQQARVLAALALLVLLGGMAFSAGDDRLPPGVFAEIVTGQVFDADTGDTIGGGGRIEIAEPFVVGDAETRLRGNFGEITLRAATEATGFPRTLQLDRGAALIRSEDVFFAVTTPDLFASGTGLWRVDLGISPRAAFYDGQGAVSPVVAGAGETIGITVPLERYQEARALDGIPTGPFPVVYSSSDAWDRRNLAELFAIDEEARSLGATVDSRWGSEPRPASFYERFQVMDDELLNALSRFATTGDDDSFGVPGDVLTAVFATRALIDGAGREAAVAIDVVDTRRADGATWGVVLASDGLGLAEFQAARDLGLRNEEVLPPLPAPPSGSTPDPEPTPTPEPTPSETEEPPSCPQGQVRQPDGSCDFEDACPSGQGRDDNGECVEPCPAGQERTADGDCEDPREPQDCVDDPDAARCTVTNVIEEVLDVLPVAPPPVTELEGVLDDGLPLGQVVGPPPDVPARDEARPFGNVVQRLLLSLALF